MADRTPKPNTQIYLLRDIPRASLRAAHATLEQSGEGRTLKDALLDTVERLAAVQARRQRRIKQVAALLTAE